ncbi:MAG: tol-pal system-associated acyl-CoA thioesterase [Gammaproteobacteria bacterium]|nr:tol-pal system-associated acyl-CoA thioesterase [Gammaproteobacteria bacterium]
MRVFAKIRLPPIFLGFFKSLSNKEHRQRFLLRVRVYYEDTDALGVAYHATYLKFMERARTEWLRSLGYEQHSLRDHHGLGFTVHSLSLDFLKAARLDDLLEVSVALTRRGGASLNFEQAVRRVSDGALCCRGLVKVACVAADTLKPSPLPQQLLAEIADVR